MRIIRVQAVQAHPVPRRAYYPSDDPFSSELTAEPEIIYDYHSESAEDGTDFIPGATAQNNYTPVKYYRCKYCDERVADYALEQHICEDEQ
jgi:hypothetical protein